MGVAVQLMVDAEVSGVMFTCNPVSGDPSMVAVNASWGLGLAVVGGEVTPDDYLVSKVTREVVREHIHAKEIEYLPDAAGRGAVRLMCPKSGERSRVSNGLRSTRSSSSADGSSATSAPPGHRVGHREGARASGPSRRHRRFPDNDDRGRRNAAKVVGSVSRYAKRVRTVAMPDGHKDLTEWFGRARRRRR